MQHATDMVPHPVHAVGKAVAAVADDLRVLQQSSLFHVADHGHVVIASSISGTSDCGKRAVDSP